MKKIFVSSYSKILIFNNIRIKEFTNYNIRRLSHFQSGMSAEQRNMVNNMQVSQRINWFYEWRKILPIKKKNTSTFSGRQHKACDWKSSSLYLRSGTIM